MANVDFYRLKSIHDLLDAVDQHRQRILNALDTDYVDPVARDYHYLHLSELGQYESQLLRKLWQFETSDIQDFLKLAELVSEELRILVNSDD